MSKEDTCHHGREPPLDFVRDPPFDNTRREVECPDILGREEISPKARRVFDDLLETNSDGQVVDLCPERKVISGRISKLKVELASALAEYG